MRELSKEDIRGNRVNNLKQYYVLDYLKKNIDISSFKIYLDKNDNIVILIKTMTLYIFVMISLKNKLFIVIS